MTVLNFFYAWTSRENELFHDFITFNLCVYNFYMGNEGSMFLQC